ncbi:MAG: hypothetical protein WC564_03615 [Patescibacteria group bacterium]|jgi:transcriptional regulatory protein LevR
MNFETNNLDSKQKVLDLKKKMEDNGMKVFVDETKLDNPEALSRVVEAFGEIKNAYRITVSDAEGAILVDIEKSRETIDKGEEKSAE